MPNNEDAAASLTRRASPARLRTEARSVSGEFAGSQPKCRSARGTYFGPSIDMADPRDKRSRQLRAIRLIAIGVLCATAALIWHHRRGESKEVPPAKTDFLALGDSYTIGESVDRADRWPVQLAGEFHKHGVSIGEPWIIATTGWTTDELSAGIDRAAPQGPFRLVTLLIGVNNQFRGRSVDEFRKEFASLLERSIKLAGGKSSRVIVVSIPDYGVTPFAGSSNRAQIGKEIDAFNAVCREEATRGGTAFVDITPVSRRAANDRSLVAGDGLHPSGKMYRLWVEEILPVAQEVLKQ